MTHSAFLRRERRRTPAYGGRTKADLQIREERGGEVEITQMTESGGHGQSTGGRPMRWEQGGQPGL